jgi:hypothetical protein
VPQPRRKLKRLDQVSPESPEAEKRSSEPIANGSAEDTTELMALITANLVAARGVSGRASRGMAPSDPVTNDIKLAALDAEEILQACNEVKIDRATMLSLNEQANNTSEKLNFRTAVCTITEIKKFSDASIAFRKFLQADRSFQWKWEGRLSEYKRGGLSPFIADVLRKKFANYRNVRDSENKKRAGITSALKRKKGA